VRFKAKLAAKSQKRFSSTLNIKKLYNKNIKSIIKKQSKYSSVNNIDQILTQSISKSRNNIYLLNQKNKRVDKKVTRFQNVKSKRDFYDKIKNMFIMRMDKKEDEEAKFKEERKQILKKKLYNPNKKKKNHQSNRVPRFSNKNLIYSNNFNYDSVNNFDEIPQFKHKSRSIEKKKKPSFMNSNKMHTSSSFAKLKTSSIQKSKLENLISMDRISTSQLKNSKVINENKQNTAHDYVSSEIKRLSRASKSPMKKKKKKKYLKKEINLATHMKNMKDFLGKSIKEIYQILMENEKYSYDIDDQMQKKWKNSNLNLFRDEKYFGIKTGNTSNAKFCLASYKKEENFEYIASKSLYHYIVNFKFC
jgi:hypothetical protein